MSRWEELHFEDRIREILGHPGHVAGHHLGTPFMTSYQIAIEFAIRYPDDVAEIGLPVGGRGTDAHNSLAQYIGGELSRRIHEGSVDRIEGGFLSDRHLAELAFRGPSGPVCSSLIGAWDTAIFRARIES